MARHPQRPPDRSDPAIRAAARLARTSVSERRNRSARGRDVGARRACSPCSPPQPITGEAGATVGAVVGALLLAALAAAVWPSAWSEAETTYHELESIWHELRTDAAQPRRMGPLRRLGRGSGGSSMQLMPAALRAGRRAARRRPQPLQPRPPPADRRREHHPAPSRHGSAASEGRRPRTAEAEQRSPPVPADAIDRATNAAIQAGERDARRQLAAQEAAERRAQAEAVARALRRS